MHRSFVRRAALMFSLAGLAAAALTSRQSHAEEGTPSCQTGTVHHAPGVAFDGGKDPLPLGKVFERPSAGISFRPPAGWIATFQADREELVRFVDRLDDPVRKQTAQASLVLTRQAFETPQHLFQRQELKNQEPVWVPGIVENTLHALVGKNVGVLQGAKVLRGGDPTNIGKNDVGMIVLRYTRNGERHLAQHAIIEVHKQLYLMLSMTTPGRKDVAEDDRAEEKNIDPMEAQAVATFRKVIDSVQLLSLKELKEEQDKRLFSTRALYLNLTAEKLRQTMIEKRWLRIICSGKDVGYSYIEEKPEVDEKGGNDGLVVESRTRVMTRIDAAGNVMPFPREETEASMFTTLDRRNESWTKQMVYDDGKPKDVKNPWRRLNELGMTDFEQTRVLAADANDPVNPANQFKRGENLDPKQPWINVRERYTLKVEFLGGKAALAPVVRPLPPYYLPQGLSAMLPRLVPPNEPKGYMVASYVSDVRQVMMRYIDVEPEAATPVEIANATGKLRAIPIRDRIGYEGAPTIHWVTQAPDSKYLGSTTESTKTVVLASDEPTIRAIWKISDGRVFDKSPDGPRTRPATRPTAPRTTSELPRSIR